MNSPVLIETSSKQRLSIESIERQKRNIAILWEGGNHSLFHHIWLRDNCTCPQCGDRSGGHRYLELGSIDPDIAPDELSIDSTGSLQIRWQGDGHLIEPVYRALQHLLALVYAPEACVTYRLESGQAAVMDNHRVLHARAAFNGNRHIRQCHVDRDEFFSRLRVLQRRLDIED